MKEGWGTSTPATDPRHTLQIAVVALAIVAISSAWVVMALVGQSAEDRNTSIASLTSVGPSASTTVDPPSSHAPEMPVVATAPGEQEATRQVQNSLTTAEPQVNQTRDKEAESEPLLVEAEPPAVSDKQTEKTATAVGQNVNPYQKSAIQPRYRSPASATKNDVLFRRFFGWLKKPRQ